MLRLVIGLGLLPFLLPSAQAAPGDGPSWVLPPGSESAIRKAFDGKSIQGWTFDGAEIRSDHVGLAFCRPCGTPPKGTFVEVRLTHESAAAGVAVSTGTAVTGDAPSSLKDGVMKRLKASRLTLPWSQMKPAPAPVEIEKATEVEGEPREDDGEKIVQLGEQVEHLIARGDRDIARDHLLAAELSDIQSDAARADWAALHAMVGEVEKAKEMAKTLSKTRAGPVVRVLLEQPIDAASILGERPKGERCSLTQAGRILRRLGRFDEAKKLLGLLTQEEPGCLRAVIELSLIHVHFQDGPATLKTIERGLAETPDEHQLMMMKVSAYRLLGRHGDAVRTMEEIVRGEDRQAGNLGMLLAMYLRGQDTERAIESWKAWYVDHPDDVVAPFMVGVLLHYGNEFEESDRWLVPLIDRLHDEPRLFVYRAMNAFNLGDRSTARKLLDAAALLPVVDPDVYYCRAEITRDTERPLAIEDLGRYLALTDGTPHASLEKQARVKLMYEELLVCHQENHDRCSGPWEHPRKAWWQLPKGMGLIGTSLLLIGLAVFMIRRRKAGGSPS
jgi:tetratricopeptide (TPR) repeat protein